MTHVELKQIKGEDTRELIIRAKDAALMLEAFRLVHSLDVLAELERQFAPRLEGAEDGHLVGVAINLDPQSGGEQ